MTNPADAVSVSGREAKGPTVKAVCICEMIGVHLLDAEVRDQVLAVSVHTLVEVNEHEAGHRQTVRAEPDSHQRPDSVCGRDGSQCGGGEA